MIVDGNTSEVAAVVVPTDGRNVNDAPPANSTVVDAAHTNIRKFPDLRESNVTTFVRSAVPAFGSAVSSQMI